MVTQRTPDDYKELSVFYNLRLLVCYMLAILNIMAVIS